MTSYQYSNEEYWDMVRAYALSNDSVRGAINLYREMFPHRRIPSYNLMLGVNQHPRTFGQFSVPTYAQGRGREPYPVHLQEAILEYFVRASPARKYLKCCKTVRCISLDCVEAAA